MEQADLILTGGTVLTMNAARAVIRKGAVVIRDGVIVALGPQAVAGTYHAPMVIECSGQVVMPGLINAHTHLPMNLLRGLADDLRLDVWLHGYILPVEHRFVTPEFSRLGTLLACAELIRSGVTCFADMYYFEDQVAEAAAEVGLRGICGQTLMKFPTPDAESYDASLALCREFLARWHRHELIIPAPAPHSPYMCTPEILREAVRLAQEFDVPLLTHIAETEQEVEDSLAQHGVRPVRWMIEQGVFEARTVAAHCVHVNKEEMRLLAAHRVGVAHNPTSNLKLASGVAPVARMLEVGVNVGVGTDGVASNNDLDMFEEMRLAALLAKGITGDPLAVPAVEALAMATVMGAKALHIDHLTGSLEVGKRADVIVVDMDGIHNVPHFETTGQNVYSRLVYAAKSTDVRHVIVNGRLLMRDRELLTVDEAALLAEAQKIARQINTFFVERERNVLDKLVAISGGVEQQETFEVQVKVAIDEEGEKAVEQALADPEIAITKQTVRDQYDTYFIFADPDQGRLRYREDNVYTEEGTVEPEYTLTLTGPVKEREFAHSILMSRSRFSAPADRSLRFYREYFQPLRIKEVVKHRRRFRILYKGEEFAVNIDRLRQPRKDGIFLEVKSRTWSSQDALHKAELIGELLKRFQVAEEQLIRPEYVDMV